MDQTQQELFSQEAKISNSDQHHEDLKNTKKPHIKLIETPTLIQGRCQVEIQNNNQYVVQSSQQCVIEGAPTTQLKTQQQQIILENNVYIQQNVQQSVQIESQPTYSTVQNDETHIEQQPKSIQKVMIENASIQIQPKVEIQSNNDVKTQIQQVVQTENHKESIQIQQLPSTHLEHHSNIELQHQNNVVNQNQNLSTQIEKSPEIQLDKYQQQGSIEQHPITNLEINQNNHQIFISPIVSSQQVVQGHSIENKPQNEIHQQIQQQNTEVAPKIEIQQNDQQQIEQKQQLQVESNQLDTQLIADEEKVIVIQLNHTNIENQPSHEIVNQIQQGTIERRPRLQTQQNTNPVEVTHNEVVYIQKDEPLQIKQEEPEQQQVIQQDNHINQPIQETFQPQNDAEEQFIKSSIQKNVGALGISVAAAALTSSLIFKGNLNSKNGALAVLAGTAALFAGYKLTYKL